MRVIIIIVVLILLLIVVVIVRGDRQVRYVLAVRRCKGYGVTDAVAPKVQVLHVWYGRDPLFVVARCFRGLFTLHEFCEALQKLRVSSLCVAVLLLRRRWWCWLLGSVASPRGPQTAADQFMVEAIEVWHCCPHSSYPLSVLLADHEQVVDASVNAVIEVEGRSPCPLPAFPLYFREGREDQVVVIGELLQEYPVRVRWGPINPVRDMRVEVACEYNWAFDGGDGVAEQAPEFTADLRGGG